MTFLSRTGLQTDELCHHAGHCVNTGNTHYCKCPADYTGSYCESQVDHCEDKPCRNGATCRGYVGGYQCDVSPLLIPLNDPLPVILPLHPDRHVDINLWSSLCSACQGIQGKTAR